MREGQRDKAIALLPIIYSLAVTVILMSLFLLIFIGITEKLPLYVSTGSVVNAFCDEDVFCGEYSVEGLREGHTASVALEAKRKYVGVTLNEPTVTVYDKKGRDITYKYEIIPNWGRIEIVPAEYTVKTGSAYAEYSGNYITNDDITVSDLILGHEVKTEGGASLRDVDSVPNIPRLTIYDRDGKDITDQYVPVPEYGTLKVLPITVEISSPSYRVSKDETLTDLSSYSITSGSLAKGDQIKFTPRYTYMEKGEYENIFDVSIYRVEDGQTYDVTLNYVISKIYGKITVE